MSLRGPVHTEDLEEGEMRDEEAEQGMEDDEAAVNRGERAGKPRVIIKTQRAAAAEAAASSSSSSSSAPRRQIKTKGRGFKSQFGDAAGEDRYAGRGGEFETLDMELDEEHTEAQKSVEGWILIVTNLHEETNEDDLYELFADHGEIKQLHLNLDRRTGYVKGYALVEYGSLKEAQSALRALNGQTLHERELQVDFAFRPAPHGRGRGPRTGGGGRGSRR